MLHHFIKFREEQDAKVIGRDDVNYNSDLFQSGFSLQPTDYRDQEESRLSITPLVTITVSVCNLRSMSFHAKALTE
jgi:hypothetical protein